MDLMGVTEIAAMLGVSGQRVSQLSRTRAFPEPVAELCVPGARRRACRRSSLAARRRREVGSGDRAPL